MAPVDPTYVHAGKQATCLGRLEMQGVTLKLYDIAPEGADPEERVFAAIERWAGQHLGRLAEAGECGFVIHHRCGPEFRFLLPALWRGNNELWEAVWYRDRADEPFAPFAPAYPGAGGALRPTFCVWELGVVTHEAAAWSRYLSSACDETARSTWASDDYGGPVL